MTQISFVYDEYRVISISGDVMSFTVTCVVIAVLTLSGSSSPLNVFLIGHSESGFLRNSGPFCQELFASISFGFFPLVIQSAMLSSPFIQYQSLGFVPSLISPIRVAANMLKAYFSFGSLHKQFGSRQYNNVSQIYIYIPS